MRVGRGSLGYQKYAGGSHPVEMRGVRGVLLPLAPTGRIQRIVSRASPHTRTRPRDLDLDGMKLSIQLSPVEVVAQCVTRR